MLHIKIKNNVASKVTSIFTCSGGGDNDSCIANFKKMVPGLKYNVALANSHNPKATENEARIKGFVEEIKSGK